MMNALDLCILYVDDDPDIRRIALMSLRLDKAIDSRAAASANEALELLGSGEWHPDAVLLDVMMPCMTGPELNALIRADDRLAGIAVIFVTARARDTDLDAYRAGGAAGVIVKPFDPIGLAGRVRAMLGREGA